MATFNLGSTTASGTVSKTLTYSGPDAQRIFNAWTKIIWNNIRLPPDQVRVPPTHQDFINWMADRCAKQFSDWVVQAETVTNPGAPPPITQS